MFDIKFKLCRTNLHGEQMLSQSYLTMSQCTVVKVEGSICKDSASHNPILAKHQVTQDPQYFISVHFIGFARLEKKVAV